MTVRDRATSGRACQGWGWREKMRVAPPFDSRTLCPSEATPMSTIVPRLRRSVKDRLLRHLRLCRSPGLKTRYLIILNLVNGRLPPQVAAVLALHRATVYRVAARFRDHGERGLYDRRHDNGPTK